MRTSSVASSTGSGPVAERSVPIAESSVPMSTSSLASSTGSYLVTESSVQMNASSIPMKITQPRSGDGNISAAAAAGIGLGVAAAAGIAAAVGVRSEEEDDSYFSSSISETSSSESGMESNFAYSGVNVLPILASDSSGTESSSDDETRGSSSRNRKTALELAIEAGDWEAVGEAAAMMSDASVTTDGTSEVSRIVDYAEASSTIPGDSVYKVNTERATELDEMIDAGNWTAIVAAASRLGSGDSSEGNVARSSDHSSPMSADSSGLVPRYAIAKEQEKEKRIKEEQEALSQAEMWAAIAKQSRTEGSTDAAARDAADWAITRSLSTLRKAELGGDLEKEEDEEEK